MLSTISRLLFRLVLGSRRARLNGQLRVRGVRGEVVIRRDRFGIPHIEAQSENDAWFGLGFCHGQDRAFQLELLQRITRGTLSELIGPKGVGIDRMARRVGFHRCAVRQMAQLAPDVREVLTSFANGVTAGGDVGLSQKPHEMALLGGRLSPWTAEDVVGFVKLQSFSLPSNWDAELARLHLYLEDGSDAVRCIDPIPESALHRLDDDLNALAAVLPRGGGSNNWVIGSQRTETGRPLLANDPHLAPMLPGQWYLAHLRTPAWEVAGATFAGCPAIVAGHNGFAAWGVTAGLTDNSDFFVEQISADGRMVRDGDQWIDCPSVTETINVKGSQPIIEQFIETPRGPIVTPVFGNGPAISLRAVWLDALPIRGFLAVHRSQSFDEFRECFSEWPVLPLNIVYADTTNRIGCQLVGQVPRRTHRSAAVPGVGWDPSQSWKELVPFDQMPHVADPSAGFFATANNDPDPDETGPFLGLDWMDPFRFETIRDNLSARTDWNVDSCQRLQLNQHCRAWPAIREFVLSLAMPDHDGQTGQQLLRDWDGHLSADSAAALVYEVFIHAMHQRVAQAKAPVGHRWALGYLPVIPGRSLFYLRRMDRLVRLIREQPSGWFEQPWTEILAEVLSAAAKRCREELGPSTARWSWGHVHRLTLKHPLLGQIAPWHRIFNRGGLPIGGDADTVFQAAVPLDSPFRETDNIPGMRMVIDVGHWSRSRFVLAGGQSGNPFSPHFVDLFEFWQRGEGVPIAWTPTEVREAATSELLLQPHAGIEGS